jgi:hypothetical protein
MSTSGGREGLGTVSAPDSSRPRRTREHEGTWDKVLRVERHLKFGADSGSIHRASPFPAIISLEPTHP